MPLVGTLSTMPLPDLLQWLGTAAKTGTLRVERDKVCKVIRMRKGRIVGCSSDDPPQRFGQFLLSRRKISEEQLRQALATQNGPDAASTSLGKILVDMCAISEDAVVEELALKAEEVIFSLFDWDHGTFRFEDKLAEEPWSFPVDLQVQDVMLRGLKRHDEMSRIRGVFHDTNMILRYTSKPPGAEIFSNDEFRTMYSSIDGERSIADIVLHVHGSGFLVQKFLYELHENGYIEICGVKRPDEETVDTAETVRMAEPLSAPRCDSLAPGAAPIRESAATSGPAACEPMAELDLALEFSDPEPAETVPAAVAPRHTAVAVAECVSPAPVADLPVQAATLVRQLDAAPDSKLGVAGRMMIEGDFESALDVLDELYREAPNDEALRRLTAEAEAAFVDKAYRHVVPASKVPFLLKELGDLDSESLTPHECFLLSRIDGTWDVKSITQVAPFREVEALRALKRMRELGMIDLKDPA